MEEWIITTQYTEEFIKDAVRYLREYPELEVGKCAKNLGISKSALSAWGKAFDANEGNIPTIGEITKVTRQ